MQNTTKYSIASWDTTKKCHVTKQSIMRHNKKVSRDETKKITRKNVNEH